MNKRVTALVVLMALGMAGGVSASVPAPTAPVLANESIIPSAEVAATDLVGSLPGSFRVSESGAATYSVPIDLPKGSGGVTPPLSLSYSSSGGNRWLGVGWNLGGMSAVSRCRPSKIHDGRAMPVTMSAKDRFCLDGQRLILVSGTYGSPDSVYKKEQDDFSKITARGGSAGHPDYFEVDAKDGSFTRYGNSGTANSVDSEQGGWNGSAEGGQTIQWAIDEFRDNVGNKIDYRYSYDANGFRPSFIYYAFTNPNKTPNSFGTPNSRVQFVYGSRQDPINGYMYGFQDNARQRLTSIQVSNFFGGSWQVLRDYRISYKPTSVQNKLSRISSLQECYATTGNNCLPATDFTWTTDKTYGFSAAPEFSVTMSSQSDRTVAGRRVVDINGDGQQDVIWLEPDFGDYSIDYQQWMYILSNNGGYDEQDVAIRMGGDGSRPADWQILDYNADGRTDLAIHNRSENRWYVYLSTLQSNGKWAFSQTGIATPVTSSFANFMDLNGDGLVDAVHGSGAKQLSIYYLTIDTSKSSTSPAYYKFKPPVLVGVTSDTLSATWARPLNVGAPDFNGDGKVDLVMEEYYYETHNSEMEISILLSDAGPNGEAVEMESYNLRFADVSLREGYAESFGDFNGDGLTDIFVALHINGYANIQYAVRLNDGTKFLDPVIVADTGVADNGVFDRRELVERLAVRVMDYNEDGFDDIVYHGYNERKLAAILWDPATKAFVSTVQQHIVIAEPTSGNYRDSYFLLDMGGNGVVDALHFRVAGNGSHLMDFYRGTGSGHPSNKITQIKNGLDAYTDINYEPLSNTDHYVYPDFERAGNSRANCNLNISSHFCEGYYFPNSSSGVNSFYSGINTPNWPLPAGSHSFGKDSDRNGEKEPVLNLNGPIHVVTSVSSSAPVGGVPNGSTAMSTVEYFYADAKIQAMGRGMLGFAKLMTKDVQSGVQTTTSYRQDFPFVGMPLKTEARSSSGHLLSVADNTWRLQQWDGSKNGQGVPNYQLNYFQPFLFKSEEKAYNLVEDGTIAGGLLKTVVTDTEPDTSGYGNIRSITVTTTGDGKTYKTITTNTYGSTTFDKEKGRLIRAEVQHQRTGEATITRASEFSYFSSGTYQGMLQTETIEPGTNFQHMTTYTYDSFGNKIKAVVTAKDPNTGAETTRCNAQTVQLDTTGRYVSWEKDCLGRMITKVDETKRNKYGAPKRVLRYVNTAATAQIEVHYAYTPGGRRYFEADTTGAFTATTLTDCAGVCNSSAHYSSTWGPGNSLSPSPVELAREYVDVLGRIRNNHSRGFDGTWISQYRNYDNRGRVMRQNVPQYTGPFSSFGGTHWEYDLLGRVKRITMPDGTVTTSAYNGYSTVHTSHMGLSKTETRNALGELVSVKDHANGVISYRYDAQGNLTHTTHNNGTTSTTDDVVISLAYDKLGRKTSMSDPDKGNWQYQYTAFGELKKQTNAKGQKTELAYDGLGRKTVRIDTLASGTVEGTTQWVYDSGEGNLYSLGQLVKVQDLISGYKKVLQYDSLGRLSKTVTSLGVNGTLGNHYEKVTYDQYGRVYQVFDAARNDDTYTNNGVEQRYNAYGYQHQTVDAVYSGSSTRKIYSTVIEMDAWGNVTEQRLGNGVSRHAAYNIQSNRVERLYSSPGRAIQDQRYTWDDDGKLDYMLDFGRASTNTSSHDRKTDYSYDNLNRLIKTQWYIHSSNTVIRTDNTGYNLLGNITSKTGVGSYSYDKSCGCGPHAVTKAGNTTFQYDANGNMVRDSSGRKIAYTTFDKPYYLEKGATKVTFNYNTERSRYVRTDTDAEGTKTTLYIGSVEKITNKDGSKEWKRYIGGGLMITQQVSQTGTITSSEDRYFLKDHLGSIQYILDGSGLVVQSMSFDPWGDRMSDYQNEGTKPWAVDLYNILETTRGFTGHEMVDGLDIVHMNGRIYDSRLARFLQADPVIDGATSTQGYNRYSYVHNNPLNATDPSGFSSWNEFRDGFLKPAIIGLISYGVCNGAGAACYAGVTGALSTGNALDRGADLDHALEAGAIAGVSAAAFYQVGQSFSAGTPGGANAGWAYGKLTTAGLNAFEIGAVQVAAHSITGGIMADVQGGKFAHGFASAGIGKAATFGLSGANVEVQFIGAVVAGGTATRITGGKFENGAATAAFGFIFNQMVSSRAAGSQEGVCSSERCALYGEEEVHRLTGESRLVWGGDESVEWTRLSLDESIDFMLTRKGKSTGFLPDMDVRWGEEFGRMQYEHQVGTQRYQYIIERMKVLERSPMGGVNWTDKTIWRSIDADLTTFTKTRFQFCSGQWCGGR